MSKTLITKIMITLGFIFIYRILAYVTVPGVDVEVIREFFDDQEGNALGLYNMFSGNAVERLSIISLGIMPYITASIIMELVAASFPNIKKLKKERDGMVKYMQLIRYFTIFITIVQAVGVSYGLQSLTGRSGQSAIMLDTNTFVLIAVASMLTGTMLLMWIGEQITQKGIGNGISLIIFAGIVSGIPSAITGTFGLINSGEINFLVVLMIIAVILITTGIIVYIELAERRIPISYSRKVQMENQNKRIMNYIPIKINLSGVIPPIFASAILMFPLTIFQSSTNPVVQNIVDWINPNGYLFQVLTFVLVVFFAYFYASIAFSGKDIAENLKRQGGFIPGTRPGASSELFLNDIASRLTLTGSIYLGLISTLPWFVVNSIGVPFYFGGVSVLIVVQVALDTMRKIEGQMYMERYKNLSNLGL